MTRSLPFWASTREALGLLRQIEADRPDYRLTGNGFGFGQPAYRYQGDAAKSLRALRILAKVRLIERAEQEADRGRPWMEAREQAFAELGPDADEIIEALLSGAIELPAERAAA